MPLAPLVLLLFATGQASGLTCFDCLEPCHIDPPMCGGLYCARLKAIHPDLTYVILHTCLETNYLHSGAQLPTNQCIALDRVDADWKNQIRINTKENIDLSAYTDPIINLCEEADAFCNATDCSFTSAGDGTTPSAAPQSSSLSVHVLLLPVAVVFVVASFMPPL